MSITIAKSFSAILEKVLNRDIPFFVILILN